MAVSAVSLLRSEWVWSLATSVAPMFLSGTPAAELENLGLTVLLQLAEGKPVTIRTIVSCLTGSQPTRLATAIRVIQLLEAAGHAVRQNGGIIITGAGRDWAFRLQILGAAQPPFVPSLYLHAPNIGPAYL